MPCFDTGRTVTTDSVTVLQDNGSIGIQSFTVTAPSGHTPISGGYQLDHYNPGPNVTLVGTYPTSDGTGWTFELLNGYGSNRTVSLYVVSIAS